MAPEQPIGVVTDYFARIGVAAVRLTDGDLRVGDRIRVQGHTTDFVQVVESLQVEHQPVQHASRGAEVAVKVRERVRKHDRVARVEEG